PLVLGPDQCYYSMHSMHSMPKPKNPRKEPRMSSQAANTSEDVRIRAENEYVNPARARKAQQFSITVGEVHKGLGLHNRVPQVCAALKSEKFLRRNGLRLVRQSGPPSGQSTTVVLTYEFEETESQDSRLMNARGIARDAFRALGGGEKFIRSEREVFAP